MDDLISRQAAIDALARMMPRSYTPDGSHPADEEIFRAQEVFADCIEALEILPSAQPATNCSEIPNGSDDTISRRAAIEKMEMLYRDARDDTNYMLIGYNHALSDMQAILKSLPSAQPEQQHGRIFQEIVVRYPSYNPYPEYQGKPYFSIKYTKNGQEFIGYSTYKPEVLSEYLKEYFMPSAQPEQHLCRDCKWAKYYGNVDKNGNVESYWYCTNWYGGTDEEGYCHEWESR